MQWMRLRVLKEQGISATVARYVLCETIRYRSYRKSMLPMPKQLITVEEHAPFGGLGSMVSQVVGSECPKKGYQHGSAGCTGNHRNF